MLSYRLGTVNDFHWEYKPVLSYSKLHTFLTFLEKKKKEKCIYSLQPSNRYKCIQTYRHDNYMLSFSYYF